VCVVCVCVCRRERERGGGREGGSRPVRRIRLQLTSTFRGVDFAVAHAVAYVCANEIPDMRITSAFAKSFAHRLSAV
jgi:hypothetical protein